MPIIARSRSYSIPILRGQKGAPFTVGVHIDQLPQQMKAQARVSDALDRCGENVFGAPLNAAEQVRLELSQTDQPIPAVGRRPQDNVVRLQTTPGFTNVLDFDRRAIRADNGHVFCPGLEGAPERGLQALSQIAVALRAAAPALLQPVLDFAGRIIRAEAHFDPAQPLQLIQQRFNELAVSRRGRAP